MAYYDALIEAWNNPTQPPPGITGDGLDAAMTTDEKIVVVNDWTIVSDDPVSYLTTATDIVNNIDFAEFKALAATRQTLLINLLSIPGNLLVGSDNAKLLVPGLIIDTFPAAGPTIAALKALAKGAVRPWYSAPVEESGGGLSGPVSLSDCEIAGLS